MRIVAGEHRGRKLLAPDDKSVRPTSDKVRGAIFNALQSRMNIQNTHVIDAFCGTGALGLEALSRGAAHCTFIDSDKKALLLAKTNAQTLDLLKRARFLNADMTRQNRITAPPSPYELVFLDPPYRKSLIEPALYGLVQNNHIAENAWVVIESEKEHDLVLSGAFTVQNQKIYGDTKITLLRHTP
ncbi:MAG: 16S rRNA (guanine(966)-N(2))-methyltransferase RsmD [Alphaproteobacteria bacterium]|nr:16S rRNA (guanine(966)-N(2))-methyltransferase RsmD [Alphaproteobacteria bacterium]